MALLRVFIPVFPGNCNEIYFKGFTSDTSDSSFTIYLTKFGSKAEIVTEKLHKKSRSIYGYCGDGIPKDFSRFSGIILLNKERSQVTKLVIDGQLKSTNNSIIMYYEYDKIRDSQTITESADILMLQDLIHKQNGVSHNTINYVPSIKIPYWISSSMFLQHICNYWNLMKWFMGTVKKDNKVSRYLLTIRLTLNVL